MPVWTNNVANIPDAALHFNGVSTHVVTSNPGLFNFTTNSFTINLWLLPLTEGGYVMQNGNYQTNGWYLRIAAGSYRVQFGGETAGADNSILTTTINGWPSFWSMVTITRAGTNAPLIYINGGEVPTTGSFANPASTTNSLVFGANMSVNNGGNYLDGDIWLPQIWSAALSPSDVANLYFNQALGLPWP